MNNYKVKPASSTRSAMLKMEQQIMKTAEVQPDRGLYSEHLQTQFKLLHQMKRQLNNWENYEKQKEQGSSMFNDEYEIYQIMRNLTHEFVRNFWEIEKREL